MKLESGGITRFVIELKSVRPLPLGLYGVLDVAQCYAQTNAAARSAAVRN